MSCANPRIIYIRPTDSDKEFKMFVRCRKCYDCQCHIRANFAFRCCQELFDSKDAYFLTLNYDDEHLAELHYKFDSNDAYEFARSISAQYSKFRDYDGFLIRKKDIQLFNRNLNNWLSDTFGEYHYKDYRDKNNRLHKIKVYDKRVLQRYCCISEYGDLHHRPHFHSLVFLPVKLKAGLMNRVVARLWTKEIPSAKQVGTVTAASINYVGKHQVKSCMGTPLQHELSPIFSINSTYQGGIGRSLRNNQLLKENYLNGNVYTYNRDGYIIGLSNWFTRFWHPQSYSEQELCDLSRKSLETAKKNYAFFGTDFEFYEAFNDLSKQYQKKDFDERLEYETNRLILKHIKK